MIDCFGNRKDLADKAQALVDGGMKEHQAVRQIIGEEYKAIHDELNQIRSTVGLAAQTFTPLKEVDTSSIEKEYDAKIAEVGKKEAPKSETPETKDISQQLESFGVPKKDIPATRSLVTQLFQGIKEAGLTAAKTVGEWIGMGKGLKEDGALNQAERIFTGEEERPILNTLNDVAKWLGAWSRKNRIVKKDLSKTSDKQIVDALVEHTKKELEAWEKTKEGYEGFYDEDIPQTLNPELIAWAKKTHGRELTNDEISLYHILSSFASPAASPVIDSNIGLQIFDKYLRTGEISAYTDKQATIWETNKNGKRVDTGKPKFDSKGKPVMSQMARAYATDSLEKFKSIVDKFEGNVKKAVEWVESQHSYEELSQMMDTPIKGNKSLSTHENLSRENGGFGVFAISGPKLGSYILNRVGEHGTVTKDLWYARTMARLFGEPLIDKKGEVLNKPWATTAEGIRKRRLADEAWGKVAKDLNTDPAIIQQRIWDFEKKLWQMLGANEKSAAGKASDGFRRGVEEVSKRDSALFKSNKDNVETSGYRKQMTEDDKGNYLFFHYSNNKFNELNPEKVGSHLATSREEKTAIATSSLYTRPDRLEPSVPSDYGYIVRVPKEKVYTFNTDPLNLMEQAKERFNKENKSIAFDKNNQLAYVAKIAAEKGFPVTVAEWNIKGTKSLIAKTTEKLKVEKYTNIKPGTLNQTEYAKGTENIKPNAKRKDIPSLFKDNVAQYRVESGKNIVEALREFDGSPEATVALTHEIMHPTVVAILDGAFEGNDIGTKHANTIASEYNKATGESITVDDLISGNNEFKNGNTTDQYRAVQEFIATSWEKYHTEGAKGFSKSFQKVLDQITEAFKSVYKSLTGNEITPELRQMFDELLGKETTKEINDRQTAGTDNAGVDTSTAASEKGNISSTDSQVKPEETDTGYEQINHASIDEAREMFGMEQLESSKMTVEDIIAEAHEKHITQSILESGSYEKELAIIHEAMMGKPLDAPEQYALGNLLSKMKKEHRNTLKMIKQGNATSEIYDKLGEVNDLIDRTTQALRSAGTTAGRSLAIRKEFLNFDMYDAAGLKEDFAINMDKHELVPTETDKEFLQRTGDRMDLKKDDIMTREEMDAATVRKNMEIQAANAYAEMNKRKGHVAKASKLSEALASLDKVLKGKNC